MAASPQQPQLDGLASEEQATLMNMIDNMQTRDSLRMYNGLVERCFLQCVDSFRRKTLEKHEEQARRHWRH